MRSQILDNLDTERERGITIRSQSVSLKYHSLNGNEYLFNIIDTPGHCDFHLEVHHSLPACEGALLLVDATSGVQAQTIAHTHKALELGLDVIPVINKIDLATADIDDTKKQIENLLKIDPNSILLCSAKNGSHIRNICEHVIMRIRSPQLIDAKDTKALIISCLYDKYHGIIATVKVITGNLVTGQSVKTQGRYFYIEKISILTPEEFIVRQISTGQVGHVALGEKDTQVISAGNFIVNANSPEEPEIKQQTLPIVFSNFFPLESTELESIRKSLNLLKLNDSSMTYEPVNSTALGYGFRCGFLGSLHLEVVKDRLLKEYGVSVIATKPSVKYKVFLKNGDLRYCEDVSQFPPSNSIEFIAEPRASVEIVTPIQYVGKIINLCQLKRGIQNKVIYLEKSCLISYNLPLMEFIVDFNDKLKSITSGLGSAEYKVSDYLKADLVIVDVLVNSKKITPLSQIKHRNEISTFAKNYVDQLQNIISRENFEIKVQICVGTKILSRGTIKPYRKDVTAKCYGRDSTRKKKLLEKQKKGKRKMR